MIHFIAKKIKNLCIKVNYRWKSFHERRKLQYIDFSIISNNCWAGFVYSIQGVVYSNPETESTLRLIDIYHLLNSLQ